MYESYFAVGVKNNDEGGKTVTISEHNAEKFAGWAAYQMWKEEGYDSTSVYYGIPLYYNQDTEDYSLPAGVTPDCFFTLGLSFEPGTKKFLKKQVLQDRELRYVKASTARLRFNEHFDGEGDFIKAFAGIRMQWDKAAKKYVMPGQFSTPTEDQDDGYGELLGLDAESEVPF